ncbi:MAG: hypothetical protein FJ109_09495 [Deltaproteobacteria bacterium]|nr:hypothetical protein [Deltaproteobacteria bacterium]
MEAWRISRFWFGAGLLLLSACGTGGGVQVVLDGSSSDAADAVERVAQPDLPAPEDGGDAPEPEELLLPPDAFDGGHSGDGGDEDVAPGGVGKPCQTGDDCNDGWCIQTLGGKLCTMPCVSECPLGWECVLHLASLPDEVYLCSPRFTSLCRPCQVNADCTHAGLSTGETCVEMGESGNFCSAPCGDEAVCPEGYTCSQASDVAGEFGKYCLPIGECECSKVAVDEGAFTSCTNTNQWGTCAGERKCMAGGLTPCSASVPAKESCNGADDDCDGAVDEETGGGVCLVTNPQGSCPGTEVCADGNLICQGPSAATETCDGKDNDCDGLVDLPTRTRMGSPTAWKGTSTVMAFRTCSTIALRLPIRDKRISTSTWPATRAIRMTTTTRPRMPRTARRWTIRSTRGRRRSATARMTTATCSWTKGSSTRTRTASRTASTTTMTTTA